jgi:hypothetical protein
MKDLQERRTHTVPVHTRLKQQMTDKMAHIMERPMNCLGFFDLGQEIHKATGFS